MPTSIGARQKLEKGHPLFPALSMGGTERGLSWGAGLQCLEVGATNGGISSIYSKGVAGQCIGDGGTWASVISSSEEED